MQTYHILHLMEVVRYKSKAQTLCIQFYENIHEPKDNRVYLKGIYLVDCALIMSFKGKNLTGSPCIYCKIPCYIF